MQRLRARHLAIRPGPEGEGEGVPPELLHVPRLSKAALYWGGVIRAR